MSLRERVLALVASAGDDVLEQALALLETRRDEPRLTVEDDSRYCLYPVKAKEMYEMWQKQCNMFWQSGEITFASDAASWEKMSPEEQRYYATILAFFANADNIVMENLMDRFKREIVTPEARMFFAIQAGIESVHVDTYNRCIDAVITDEKERMALFEAVKHNPIIRAKTEWMKQWITSDASLAQRVFAWVLVEGVFFSSSFLAIFYGRRKNYFPGIGFANEKIAEDEGLHVRFGVQLFLQCESKLDRETMHAMTRSAVALEQQFGRDALHVDLLGLNVEQMGVYVQHVADVIFIMAREQPLFNVENPFPWMVGLSIVGHSNFFEKQVAEYLKATHFTNQIHPDGDDLDF